MSEVAEEKTPATKTDASDLANGGIKEKKEVDDGATDRRHSMNNNRGPYRGGRGSFRSRGSFRGGYRGRRGGGMGISTKHLDEKAMYMIFEKPISKFTANEIMAFGKDATTVGFGRGCTIHFKTPEEAKEVMEKIKELKFAGLEPNVEYAYKKRVFDTEKRTTAADEEEEESSPIKKQKVENDTAEESKGDDDEGDGDAAEGEAEEIGEEEAEDEGDADEAEGEVEGEEAEEGGDYGEEGNEEEYEAADQEYEEGGDQEYDEDEEGGEQNDENEDDIDDDEYN